MVKKSKRRKLITEDDIGSEILSSLTMGLYPNPLDCIREYVQNAVDAGASTIKVSFTGKNVYIQDNGVGMDKKVARNACRFGFSTKDMKKDVGFRGIGLYSGFNVAETLRIETHPKNADKTYVLTFNFGKMKDILEAEREKRLNGKEATISLISILDDNVNFEEIDHIGSLDSYTLVQLISVYSDKLYNLSKKGELENYILENLPVKFDPSFEYASLIEETLSKMTPPIHFVDIVLSIKGKPEEHIYKPYPRNLMKPKIGTIRTKGDSGNVLAHYWACLSSERAAIKPSNLRGFLVKTKGFSVGGRNTFKSLFKKKTVYDRYFGEFHVVSQDIIPNGARDNFEPSPAVTTFKYQLGNKFAYLSRQGDQYQEFRKGEEEFEIIYSEMEIIKDNYPQTKESREELLDLNTELILRLDKVDNRINKLEGVRTDFVTEDERTKLIENEHLLQEEIGDYIKKTKRALLGKSPRLPPKKVEFEIVGQEDEEEGKKVTILETLSEMASDLDSYSIKLFELLDECLRDSLTETEYDSVTIEFISRLTEFLEEE